MRIKLTESQIDMLQRMNEADVDLSQYFDAMKGLIKQVNGIYSKVTFSTLSEFLDGDIDASTLEKDLYDINAKRHKLYTNAYKMLERIPDDEYDTAGYDYDQQIDNMDSLLSDKITSVELILQYMSDMQMKEGDLNITKVFKDIKTMQINAD